jgi:general secretion pathway protein A
MLSNLETEKSKLMQIALIGQPNLRQMLAWPELEQFRQRITVSYHLSGLTALDTGAYINHRLRRAAIGAPLEFSRDVTDLIHLHSQGIPRKINVIADAVLLFGYGEGQRTITVDLAHEVLEELEATGVIQTSAVAASADLVGRECRLAQRERELAEQQRLIADEHRLARLRRDVPQAVAPSLVPPAPVVLAAPPAPSGPPPATIPPSAPRLPRRADPPQPPTSDPARQSHNTFWSRLRPGSWRG